MNVLTVTQLNRYMKALVDSDERLHSIYLKGEISNFTNHYKSGHFYFSLKDENSLIRAVMFRSYSSKVRFEPENGMKVVIKGSVSVFERDGQYQLYVYEMQPDGVGALHLAYEQLKSKLHSQGLFEQQYKRPLPRYPQSIGVITSPTGAAVRDIENILARRYPLAKMILYPVLVQGEEAPAQLIKALRYFGRTRSVDVIIIGRGGGSIEELWAFNNEQLAYEIFRCTVPVISAVGHETDFTIADFVADVRAPTPSAAAELAVPDIHQLMQRLDQLSDRMEQLVQKRLGEYKEKLKSLGQRECMKSPGYLLERKEQLLLGLERDLFKGVRSALENNQKHLSSVQRELQYTFTNQFQHKEQRFLHGVAKLDVLSPLKVLTRGYGMVQKDRQIISSVEDVSPGDTIEILLRDGALDCRVEQVVTPENGGAQ
ncbi:MAG TPA: exodeoxyribonuclease VII large subunit [Firmicutes bacterium]|nr:exodeoxyribonuclease VII large subunit [Bacillota bacterium]